LRSGQETKDTPGILGIDGFCLQRALVDGSDGKVSMFDVFLQGTRLGICDLARVTYRSRAVMPPH
jgi:hypothetical protein